MTPKQRFSFTEPALCTCGYDPSKKWFVYFSCTDHLTRKTIREQYRDLINKEKDPVKREKNGLRVVEFWKKRIKNGYNPFKVEDLPAFYTASEALTKILATALPTLGKRSRETYSYMVRFLKEWIHTNHLDKLSLSDFNSTRAMEYMDYLIMSRKYSGRTHNDHLIVLRTLWNSMVKRKWTEENPFKEIAMKPVTVGRNIAYNDDERERLNKMLYQQDKRMYYFAQLIYYCFIRRSELARLKIRDFDLVNHTITIPADVSKNRKQESVVIPLGLEPVLKEMRIDRYHPDEYVFGHRLQTSMKVYSNYNHISSRHNKFLKKLGIDSAKGLYSHKHTGVIAAYYATGKDVYSIMRQLRHYDLNVTMIYLKSLGLTSNDAFRNAMVA